MSYYIATDLMKSVLTAGSSRSCAIFVLMLVTALNLVGSYRLEMDEDRIDRIRRQDTNVPMHTVSGQFGDHKKPSGPSSSSPSMQSLTTSEHPTAPSTSKTSQQSRSRTSKPTTNSMSQEPKSTFISVTYPTSQPRKTPSSKATTSAPSHTSTESTTILNSVTYPTSQPGKSAASKATTSAPSHTSTESTTIFNSVTYPVSQPGKSPSSKATTSVPRHTSTQSTTISTSISTRDTSAVSFSTTSMPDEYRATTPEDIDDTDDIDATDQYEKIKCGGVSDGVAAGASVGAFVFGCIVGIVSTLLLVWRLNLPQVEKRKLQVSSDEKLTESSAYVSELSTNRVTEAVYDDVEETQQQSTNSLFTTNAVYLATNAATAV